MPAGALDGLLVADFSRVLAGPLCTMVLGDLGADVVKVERPLTGDDTRAWGPSYFLGLNRNKRSLALDLSDPGDLALARELASRADVVVESFRPGLTARWGLDHETVARANPRVVTCSISAFGVEGLPGYDLLAQAMGGWMSVTGDPDGPPRKVGMALVDMVCGLHAAIAVLAALRAGGAQRVEVSLLDSALAGLLNLASAHLNEGVLPGRRGNRHPSIAPYETFAAADGELVVACGNDAQFAALCAAIGRPELAGQPRFSTNPGRVANVDELAAELGAVLGRRAVGEWVADLRAAGVPAGPVLDVAGAFALARDLGREPVDETGGVRTVRSPMRLERTPAAVRRAPPALGEHDEELRRWLRRARPSPGARSWEA